MAIKCFCDDCGKAMPNQVSFAVACACLTNVDLNEYRFVDAVGQKNTVIRIVDLCHDCSWRHMQNVNQKGKEE